MFARRQTLVVTTTAGPWVLLNKCAIVLSIKSEDSVLGSAAREGLKRALASSKDLPTEQRVSESEAGLLLAKAFGLSSAGTTNLGLKRFAVRQLGPTLTMRPTFRGRGAMFHNFKTGVEGHEDVVLPAGCTDAELGAGMRLALSRCL